MGFINREEIKAYQFQNEFVCTDCAEVVELASIKEENILTETDIESDENLYFCDRCKERIT